VQIDAELDGELSLVERAAPRETPGDLRALRRRARQPARSACRTRTLGRNPHAFVVPRPVIRAGTLALWVAIALGTGLLAGWAADRRWGGPGGGAALEETRGTIVVQ